jgi:glycosyltransferase involved in cell wall biosynthesis
MPSTAEAFGLVYVEAWHFGKPVIGGMAPALGELIVEGVNGYRVEQNEEKVAHRLIQLLQNDALRQRIGEEGRRIQQERYTWEAVLNRHLQVWEDVRHTSFNHL